MGYAGGRGELAGSWVALLVAVELVVDVLLGVEPDFVTFGVRGILSEDLIILPVEGTIETWLHIVVLLHDK